MKNLDPRRARFIKLRMGILSGVMGIALGGFVSSAYRVQVEDGPSWHETAEKQRQRRLHIEPKRGTIYDRNGSPLAVSVEVPSVSADIAEMLHGVDSPAVEAEILRDAAARLAPVLSLDVNELYARLAMKRRFMWVKRRVTSEEASAIRTLGDPKKEARPIRGLSIEGEGHRYYPGRELAGPILGFVAPDGQGKDGLELALDDELRGHLEEVRGLRDRAGHLLFSDITADQAALEGHDVTLTLDEGIQHLAEQELDAAQKTYETKGASIVVMDPNTGEVLAIASTPGYNPNDYGESDVEARRDRAVTDRFEPGSAMKVFTLAAALASGSLQPTESIFCEHGSYKLGSVTIHDDEVSDWLSPTQILAKSSNIGALKVGLALGEPGLYAAFRRFGFGEPTGLPLPGEAAGVLRPRDRPWYEVETAIASFGQGVSVTTIQLATAFASIANGGRLLEPVLVRRITDGRGRVLREGVPHVRRETIPPQTARLLTEMLTAVTEKGGTAVEAAVPGFRVAGKTGTAQKADPATGKYSLDRFTASFTGIVPADRPRLVISVVLDEPMVGHFGGALAAPVFRRVAEASLRYLGVAPSQAIVKADRVRLQAEDDQKPPPKPVPTLSYSDVARAPSPMSIGPNEVRVPDATGLGARDALKLMAAAGLLPEIEGSGHLARQNPQAGVAAAKGSTVRLVFEPSS
jgi:cell division protein FtsI (penicillin-binding protein 3)